MPCKYCDNTLKLWEAAKREPICDGCQDTLNKGVPLFERSQLIEDWNDARGLTIESIDERAIYVSEDFGSVSLTIIKFTDGRYAIQQDQALEITWGGLVSGGRGVTRVNEWLRNS